jgi:hypothetical protein
MSRFMRGGRLLVVPALAAACAAPADEPILIRAGYQEGRCTAAIDGRIVAIDDSLDTRQWRGREIHLRNDPETPYRCLGSLIFALQRSGASRIGFISEPAIEGATSNGQ